MDAAQSLNFKSVPDYQTLSQMDAISTILKEKNIDSILAKQWNEIVDNSVTTNFDGIEPWKSIGVKNPCLASYLDFAKYRDKLKSTNIAENILNLFSQAIEIGMQNGEIYKMQY
jgi:hypothetical protein